MQTAQVAAQTPATAATTDAELALRAVEEMSVEDVAAALEIPEATVRTRFFRACGLLREGLSQPSSAME